MFFAGRENWCHCKKLVRCIATFSEPVVVSAAPPNDQMERKALFQDLSSVPPHLVHAWVDIFIENATGKGSSFKQDLRALLLHLETVLENYAQGLPAVIQAYKICLDLTNPSKFK